MKYLFILNPKAGRKKNASELVNAIDERMSSSGYQYEFAYTTAAGDATRIARNAVTENFTIIVAVGGDGTVNEVGSGLVRQKSILGIIPLGSGNGIARSLDIPQTFDEAIEVLLAKNVLEIDVGILNGRKFIGIAGAGYDALIGRKFQAFGVRGPLPYFFISVREYLTYRCQNYEVQINDESLQLPALMVTFANTREFGNGAVIAPMADPSDGFLDICMIKPSNLWGALKAGMMLFNNTISEHPDFISRKCQSVTVQAGGEEMYIHRDGEPDVSAKLLEVSLMARALHVCSPLGKERTTSPENFE